MDGIHELNAQWLELLAAGADRMGAMLRGGDGVVLQRMARCPFPLVEFRSQDGAWWRAAHATLERTSTQPPALPECERTVEVAHTALILAWSTARMEPRCAVALLGMAPEAVNVLREFSPGKIGRLAAMHYRELRPQCMSRRFMAELLAAAKHGRTQRLRGLHVRGLQLLLGQITWPGARS